MRRSVIFLNDYGYVNGGASAVAFQQAQLAKAGGWNVVFFCAVPPPADIDLDNGVSVIDCGQQDILSNTNRIEAGIQGMWNRHAASKLRGLLSTLSPSETVIHLHGYSKALSTSVVREAAMRGFPIVCTLHDYFIACPNGAFFDHQMGGICTKKPLSIDCITCNCDARHYAHKLWRVGRQVIQRIPGQFPSSVQHYISPSELTMRVLRKYLPETAKIHVLPSAVPPLPFTSPIPAPRNNKYPFVFVGRLSPEKGVALYVEACNELGVHPYFVGSGPMQQWVHTHAPDANITGWQSKEGLAKNIASSHALVFPSLWYETQGLTPTEAASVGIPSIVPNGCAAADHVLDGQTGLHFEQGSKRSLIAAMRALLNTDTSVRMGNAAYDIYLKSPLFNLEGHKNRLLEIYDEVIRQPKPGI